MNGRRAATIVLLLTSLFVISCQRDPREVERPEKIFSKRIVVYDSSTYASLAQLWRKYNDAYPSEDAFANWMYAARYANDPDYRSMLTAGMEKYPSNPVILYLAGNEKCSRQENLEGLQLLERAAALDPSYMDPWYGLVVSYLSQGDREKADAALRQLLNSGAIQDAVMDFSYNMIACTDSGAILVTNGDNDTYPGWVLTRIIRFRPDVNIVNRSLLNTEWYPSLIVKEGVPPFITGSEMDTLEAEFSADLRKARAGQMPAQNVVLIGDRLVERIVHAARREGRLVYFTCTLESNDVVRRFRADGLKFGLVTLVTPATQAYPARLGKLLKTWETDFRTGGLDSWQLHAARETRADRMLVRNYAGGLHALKDRIEEAGPGVQLALFRWYQKHLIDLLPKESVDEMNRMWCWPKSPPEIREWCKRQNLAK